MTDAIGWPVSVDWEDSGLSPRELGLVAKVAGVEIDELVSSEKARAMGFVALMRLYPERDPSEAWERALDTRIVFREAPKAPNPLERAG